MDLRGTLPIAYQQVGSQQTLAHKPWSCCLSLMHHCIQNQGLCQPDLLLTVAAMVRLCHYCQLH